MEALESFPVAVLLSFVRENLAGAAPHALTWPPVNIHMRILLQNTQEVTNNPYL